MMHSTRYRGLQGLSTVLFLDGLGADVTAIIGMCRRVAAVLPVLLTVTAIGSHVRLPRVRPLLHAAVHGRAARGTPDGPSRRWVPRPGPALPAVFLFGVPTGQEGVTAGRRAIL